jgi:hypothetical protein
MAITYDYNPQTGSLYAQVFALYDYVPPEQRLFYYAQGDDCTNFISQCVWAAYGGWTPGFSQAVVVNNAARIRADVRQTRGMWYGSKSNIGSNRWCRVEEFFRYVTEGSKSQGPLARQIAQGVWNDVDPGLIQVGDVVQMVVTTYVPDRFGHGLYVIKSGPTWDDILICCHSDDRLGEPMGWFAQFPDVYAKLRVLRFSAAYFDS